MWLRAHGFVNTTGCYWVRGLFTFLRVWVHTHGGQAEVVKIVRGNNFKRLSRTDHVSSIDELEKFFAPYLT